MILPDTDMFLYRHPVDMRKQVNGLVSIVSGEMQLNPMRFPAHLAIGMILNLVLYAGLEFE